MGQMRGRRSVNWCGTGIVALCVLSMTFSLAAAKQYNVGDATGWITNYNYSDWAAQQTFHEGDTIAFTYTRGEHDVLRVSPEDYEACRASNPIESDASGQSTFQLHAGPNYFICGFPTHCTDGSQRVSFNVEAALAPTANPAYTNSDIPTDNPSADTPIAYGPSGAFAPAAAPSMSQPNLLPSLMLLTFGFLLATCGSNLLTFM